MLKKSFSYASIACSIGAGMMLFLTSCTNHTETKEVASHRIFPEYHYALDSVIKSKDGILSGIELGQNKNKISARELNQAIEKSANHITFEQKIDSISKYNITYLLENDTITEIELEIISQSSDEGDKILTDLKNYYRIKYTAPVMDKGYFVFNCFDSQKRNFIITLTDNSDPNNSIIDMSVYREK